MIGSNAKSGFGVEIIACDHDGVLRPIGVIPIADFSGGADRGLSLQRARVAFDPREKLFSSKR